jgi:hypothetical protein
MPHAKPTDGHSKKETVVNFFIVVVLQVFDDVFIGTLGLRRLTDEKQQAQARTCNK